MNLIQQRSTLFPYTTLFRSLLQRLLLDPTLSDTAVLINEFGEIGLDHHLLAADRAADAAGLQHHHRDRKSTRLNSSHANISYAVFCLKKKKHMQINSKYTHI